jgi:hypothetical protein
VHTGTGAFEAIAGDTPGFAVAATTEPLVVVPGRTLRVQAQLRTGGGARACVRLYFSGGSDSSPFVFRGGAPLQAHDAWEAAAAEVTVPPLVERCQVEVVAIWPAGGSASFDDVAVVEAGAGAPLERRIEEAAATVVGNAHAVAIRSMDPDLATLLAVLPAQAPADSGPLQAAGLCCLSHLGLQVQVEVDERSCTLALAGGEALALEFPADSSNGLLVGGDGADGGFAGAAATGEFTARQLLLGVERATRCMVELAQPGVVRAQLGGGHYRLELPAAGVKLVLGFRSERNAAGELLRRAQHEPQPGRALDTLRELLRTVPHDLETLAQASALRSELQTALQTELARIAANLDEASFFRTRGAFERAVAQLAALRERYGEQNLPDPQAVATLQETATTGLRAIEQQQAERKRERLEAMATAFTDAQQQGLADLVRDYVRRHLGGRE